MYDPNSEDYIEKFATGALRAALWADAMPQSEGENAETGMDAGEANGFDLSDMEPDSRSQFEEVCGDFCKANAEDLRKIEPGQAGYDFWLTSGGHGAGFWDRGLGAVGERLTEAAKVYTFDGVWVEDGVVWIDY